MIKLNSFFGYIIAGVIGACIVLGANQLLLNPEPTGERIEENEYRAVKAGLSDEKTSTSEISVPSTFNAAAKRATPAVVKVKSLQRQAQRQQNDNPFQWFFGGDSGDMFGPRVGAGSGVIISSDGYIVTNSHVVEGGDEFEVILDDRRSYKAEKIGSDSRTDLAVLKIEAENLPTLEYADSDDVLIGDWVLAIGNPFEYLTSTVTAGIVSAKGRNIDILSGTEKIESFIQTDAAVNPGNSGGALVDLEGKLVGINTAIATQTGTFSGYSFAIPVNLMRKISEDIIEYGGFKRAMLGVGIAPIEADMAQNLGIDVRSGVLVNNVTPGGAAELGGVLPMDVIATIDGRKVKTVPQIQEMIGGKKVGDIVDLEIIRKGKRKELSVRLKEG